MKKKRIPRLVLTGGPCGGKSTALAILSQKLPEYGITPIMVPEVPTLVFSSGVKVQDMVANWTRNLAFQKQLIVTQLAIEKNWEEFARMQLGDQKVLICDRGAMDGAAYMDKSAFEKMVEDMGMRIVDLRDGRYDAVFHLVTAANGAEKFYTLGNNTARHETPEQARVLDGKTANAWNGHDHFKIFPNYTLNHQMEQIPIDFETKMGRLLHEVCATLRIPAPIEVERKFLIPLDTDPATFPVLSVVVEIVQTYLRTAKAGVEKRIRKRMQNNASIYTYTEKQKVGHGARLEKEQIISDREYARLYTERDRSRKDVKKLRYSFIWENQYFQLDRIDSPAPLALLEAEVTDIQQKLLMPPFIKVSKEVTDDSLYNNSSIAAGLCPGYR